MFSIKKKEQKKSVSTDTLTVDQMDAETQTERSDATMQTDGVEQAHVEIQTMDKKSVATNTKKKGM